MLDKTYRLFINQLTTVLRIGVLPVLTCFITGAVGQVACYLRGSTAPGRGCEGYRDLQVDTIPECCLGRNGLYFESGGEPCERCERIGWYQTSSYILPNTHIDLPFGVLNHPLPHRLLVDIRYDVNTSSTVTVEPQELIISTNDPLFIRVTASSNDPQSAEGEVVIHAEKKLGFLATQFLTPDTHTVNIVVPGVEFERDKYFIRSDARNAYVCMKAEGAPAESQLVFSIPVNISVTQPIAVDTQLNSTGYSGNGAGEPLTSFTTTSESEFNFTNTNYACRQIPRPEGVNTPVNISIVIRDQNISFYTLVENSLTEIIFPEYIPASTTHYLPSSIAPTASSYWTMVHKTVSPDSSDNDDNDVNQWYWIGPLIGGGVMMVSALSCFIITFIVHKQSAGK